MSASLPLCALPDAPWRSQVVIFSLPLAHPSYLYACTGPPIPGVNGKGSLYDVEIYDIDISYPSSVVADLQNKGKKVMCYVSGGTSEDLRDDINLFPEEAQGGIVSFGEGDTVRACNRVCSPCADAAANRCCWTSNRAPPPLSKLEAESAEPIKSFRRLQEADT